LIIEWIGCSGAGKSTLREEVYKNLLSSGVDTYKPLEIFLGKNFSKLIASEKIRNIILDLIILPWSLYGVAKHRKFFNYCLKILKRDYSSFWSRIRLLRSIFRKTGLFIFLNYTNNKNQLILVDEGTLHISHLLFANGIKNEVSPNDIKMFCELVPTPELIIHIMTSKTDAIARTLNRKDKPISDTSPDSLKRFISLGHEIFNIIDDLNLWDKKTITYYNSNQELASLKKEALNLTNQILNYFPSLKK